MILVLIVAFSCGIMGPHSGQDLASGIPYQDRSAEIANLLAPQTTNGKEVWSYAPGPATLEEVRPKLIQIANQSPGSRKSVIDALIRVLNDPKEEFDMAVYRWRFAAALLGELKATEAIDDLIRNITWTSYHGWPRIYPVRAALIKIGEPAIPRLLVALSDSNEMRRWEASEALGEIGGPCVDGLLDVLARAGPHARSWAAHALALVGNARGREAIELALSVETDAEAKKHLEYAISHMDHVECLRDSSKCK